MIKKSDVDLFFEKSKDNLLKKYNPPANFLFEQHRDLDTVKVMIDCIEKSLLNLKEFGRSGEIGRRDNGISRDLKKDQEIFTLNQTIESARYKPGYQNFDKNYEIVFSGCSETQGEYVAVLPDRSDHENIWGFRVANGLNKDALNLALQGQSTESIVKGIMHHVRKNGNPKVLLVLVPDFGRLDFVINDKIKSDKRGDNSLENVVQQYLLQPFYDEDFKKISRSPHTYTDVLPYSQALYRSLQSILILDTYCKSSGIFFKYSSWSLTSNFILKTLKDSGLEEYQNYVEGDFFNWSENCKQILNMGCHEEYKKDNMKDLWDSGFDNMHMGIHRHIHIAERFIEEIEKDNPWDK